MIRLLGLVTVLLSNVLSAEPILKATSSWDGGAIAYPEGKPEITSSMLRIEQGQAPPFHCHPVPTMGYVLQGTLKVETREGKTVVLKAGESVVEVMRTVHRGVALGGPVDIVVFYAGAEGMPVTILADQDISSQYCKP